MKTFGQIKHSSIDEYVSADFPGEVVKLDKIFEGLPIVRLYSTVGKALYLLSKVKINKEANFKGLPYNDESLYEVCNESTKGFVDGLEIRNFEILSTSKITIGKFKGSLLKIKIDNVKTGEVKIVVLGEYLYMAAYFNVVNFNEKDKDTFLNSMVINPESPSQFFGTKPGF